jgi:Na+/proline symporter
MNGAVNAVTVGVLVYIVLQLAIGFWVSRRIQSEADYLLAGRSLGYGLATFSIFATWFGAETCIGSAGKAYAGGLSSTSGDPFGYTLTLLLLALVFAVPLYRRGLTTLADLYRQRWGSRVEKLAALVMVPTSILWAAAQIRAFGMVLGATSAWTVDVTVLIAGALVIVYTAAGGMLADAISDVLHGVVLIIGLVILVVAIVVKGDAGGAAHVTHDQLALFDGDRPLLATLEIWAIPVLGSVMAQELVGRVVAAKNIQVARRATLIGCALYFGVGILPVGIGLVASHTMPGLADPEKVLVLQAAEHLPTILHIVFAGALVSAILSTVDSALLTAGSLTAHNVIIPLRPSLDERTKIFLNRGCVVLFGFVACGLAFIAEGVYELVETASALGSAGVFVTATFALFTNFGGARAAAATLATGVLLYAGSSLLGAPYPFLTSLAGAFAVFLVVGLAERAIGTPAQA